MDDGNWIWNKKQKYFFSLIVNIPLSKKSFVLDFSPLHQNDIEEDDFEDNSSFSSNENYFYFSFNDDVPDF